MTFRNESLRLIRGCCFIMYPFTNTEHPAVCACLKRRPCGAMFINIQGQVLDAIAARLETISRRMEFSAGPGHPAQNILLLAVRETSCLSGKTRRKGLLPFCQRQRLELSSVESLRPTRKRGSLHVTCTILPHKKRSGCEYYNPRTRPRPNRWRSSSNSGCVRTCPSDYLSLWRLLLCGRCLSGLFQL